MMTKALAVARWEYIEKLRSKAFLIGLFLTPLLMVGMGVVPTLLISQADTRTKIIGVIDPSGVVVGPLAGVMQSRYRLENGEPNYIIRPLNPYPGELPDSATAAGDRLSTSGDIEGYCILGATPEADTAVEYRSKSVGDFQLLENLRQGLRSVLAERKGVRLGLDTAVIRALSVSVQMKQVKLTRTGEKEDSGFLQVFFSAYVFLFMLFLLIVTSGQLLVRSILEEKSNRIVEVLVSSCAATELMAGKVLGLSALGFTQIAFWSLIGAVATLFLGVTLVTPGVAALLVVYFVLGYLFYAARHAPGAPDRARVPGDAEPGRDLAEGAVVYSLSDPHDDGAADPDPDAVPVGDRGDHPPDGRLHLPGDGRRGQDIPHRDSLDGQEPGARRDIPLGEGRMSIR